MTNQNQTNYNTLTLPIATIIAVIIEQLKNLPTSDHLDKPGHATYLAIMAQTTEQLTCPNQSPLYFHLSPLSKPKAWPPYLADLIRQLWGLKGWDPYRINPEYPNPIQGKHPTDEIQNQSHSQIPKTDQQPVRLWRNLKAPTLPVKEFREAAKKIYGPDWNPCIDYDVMDAYLEKQKAKQEAANQAAKETKQHQPDSYDDQGNRNEQGQCNTQDQ